MRVAVTWLTKTLEATTQNQTLRKSELDALHVAARRRKGVCLDFAERSCTGYSMSLPVHATGYLILLNVVLVDAQLKGGYYGGYCIRVGMDGLFSVCWWNEKRLGAEQLSVFSKIWEWCHSWIYSSSLYSLTTCPVLCFIFLFSLPFSACNFLLLLLLCCCYVMISKEDQTFFIITTLCREGLVLVCSPSWFEQGWLLRNRGQYL